MSDLADIDGVPPGEATAAEYALGLLDGAEWAEAHGRMEADPAFAREVETWEGRWAALAAAVPPSPAPAAVWRAIEARTGSGVVVDLGLRRRLNAWRAATAAAGAIAAALAVAVVWPRPAPKPVFVAAAVPRQPMMTAELSGAHGPTVFVALYDPSRREVVLAPAAVRSAADRSPELWLIPTGGKPIPLGVAEFGRAVKLTTMGALSGGGGMLAVSIEPLGGSPTGQPTGPVVATGRLRAI